MVGEGGGTKELFELSLVIRRNHGRKAACKAIPVPIRCEQSTQQGNGLDVWLGRLAMVGFAVAITVEISTGKGLLEVYDTIVRVNVGNFKIQCVSKGTLARRIFAYPFTIAHIRAREGNGLHKKIWAYTSNH